MNTIMLFDNDTLRTGYVVLHRPGRSGKWVELGRAATMFETLDLIERIHSSKASNEERDG